jgi:HSP20 family molecular chaperone IbpA
MVERTTPVPAGQAAPAREPTRAEETSVPPPVDIYEDDQGLVVLADLPGVEPSGLDVRVDRGVLTIQGRAAHLAAGNPISREYQLTGFFRQFQLPDEVDPGRISAELKHGVLTLRLPRTERAQPRRIEVRAS